MIQFRRDAGPRLNSAVGTGRHLVVCPSDVAKSIYIDDDHWYPSTGRLSYQVSSVNPSVLTFTRTQVHVSNQLESLAQEPLLFILFVTVPVPVPVQRSYSRRSGHDEMYQVPYARTNVYKYSFVPATVRTWNTLPATLIHSHSLQSFKTGVSVYIRH